MPIVSGGGTPALPQVGEFPMLTEHRAGTYVYNDKMMVHSGVAAWDDCALRIRMTVVSRPTETRAVLDGGSKTLSSDQYYVKDFGHILEYPGRAHRGAVGRARRRRSLRFEGAAGGRAGGQRHPEPLLLGDQHARRGVRREERQGRGGVAGRREGKDPLRQK